MNAEQIARANHRLDRVLADNGFMPTRASEFVLSKPCKGDKVAGDHARFMCAEVRRFLSIGDIQRALRWLRFIQGATWALGLRSLEEVRNLGSEE